MRFGIPKYRLPRDVLDAEVAAHPRHGRRARAEQQCRRTCSRRCARAASTRRSSPSAPTSASARTSRPGRRRGSWTRSRCCAAWRARSRRCSAGASSSTAGGDTAMDAARTAKRLGATEAVVVYRRTRERMPAHDFEVEEAARGGRDDEVALDRSSTPTRAARAREDGARRVRLPPADRRVRGARGGLARPGARPGGRPVAARRRARHRGRGRRRPGRAEHDDRPRRASSRAATWCRPSAP